MIGFGANKTADTINSSTGAVISKGTATTDNGSNYILDIAKTKELYFHGERIGLTDNEAKYLRIKTQAWVADNLKNTVAAEQTTYNNRLTGSVTFTPTTSFIYGTSQTYTITVKVAWDGKVNENVDIEVKAYQYTGNLDTSWTEMSGVTITSSGAPSGTAGESGYLTFTYKATSVKSSVCFRAFASYAPGDTQASDGTTLTAKKTLTSAGVSSYTLYYYGLSSVETITKDNFGTYLTTQGKNFAKESSWKNRSVTFSADDGYWFIAIQSGVSAGNLPDNVKLSNGFGLPFTKQASTVVYNNVTYVVYRISNKQNAGTTLTFTL